MEREAGAGLDAKSFAESGCADILAGESSAEKIDSWRMGDCCDIGEPLHVGKVVREDARTERIDLALPGDARRDASLDERREDPELKPGDTGIQRSDRDDRSAHFGCLSGGEGDTGEPSLR